MFNIWKKKEKLHIDCFTNFGGITKLFPIESSSAFMPEWFKKLPTTAQTDTGGNVGTVKLCPGITDTLKAGIVIPVWCDMFVDHANGVVKTEPEEMADGHPSWQWGNHSLFKGYHHLKISSPWRFREKTGAKFMMTNSFWNDPQTNYFVPNGILDFKYQTTTNINIWIPKNKFGGSGKFLLEAGNPLVQIIPLEDKEIVIHMQEVSDDVFYGDELDYIFTQKGMYYKRKNILSKREGKKT